MTSSVWHDKVGSRFLRGTGTVALLLAVAAATAWGLGADRTTVVDTGEIAVDGGMLRLEAVRGELLQHDLMPMPAGSMPDEVPDGYTRMWVDLTLAATDATVTWVPEDFTLRGPGGLETPVRRVSVDPVAVPRGSAASFALQFEVPAGVEGLELHLDGADQALALTFDPDDQHVDDH